MDGIASPRPTPSSSLFTGGNTGKMLVKLAT